jgi:hypothetical protein
MKLFGELPAAYRPEAGPHTARHDESKIIFHDFALVK